ncbi:hypothetical protein [Cellulophaga sp. Z1A5H]|uniref:hypothetical protein n=1 Tax=Cellulophaga sp. Z1A5H TaxID=2687291 RepID=UPI0013FE3914|nr:hypothetical protein [Cellulophaga sp. Z1A5H]
MMKIQYVILFLILGVSAPAIGQEEYKVPLTEYIREIQIWKKDGENMTLSFWLPRSYWRIALADNPAVPQEMVRLILETLDDYIFVCALDVAIHLDGSMNFASEETLRNSITVKINEGIPQQPIPENQLDISVRSISETMKPMFENMMGQFGAGMHFYFFENKDENGALLVDEYKEGEFTISHSKNEFQYALPLTTLLPPKYCPVDKAAMKGNWSYSPFHGKMLD